MRCAAGNNFFGSMTHKHKHIVTEKAFPHFRLISLTQIVFYHSFPSSSFSYCASFFISYSSMTLVSVFCFAPFSMGIQPFTSILIYLCARDTKTQWNCMVQHIILNVIFEKSYCSINPIQIWGQKVCAHLSITVWHRFW